MAADPLKIPESLRPWHYAGIYCFLANSPVNDFTSLPLEPPGGSIAEHEARRFAFTRSTDLTDDRVRGRVFFAPPEAFSGRDRPGQDARRAAGIGMSALPVRDNCPSGVMDDPDPGFFITSGGGKNFPAGKALESTLAEDGIISAWPDPWKAIFEKTIRAPLLWTYWELGRDLTGGGDPGRAKFLRDLIFRLDLPRGSSAFWPVCLGTAAEAPADDKAAICPEEREIFYQGLRLIRPLMVIFFGTECADNVCLGLENLNPFGFQIKDGALYVFFPPLERLLANIAAVDLCAEFLRKVFSDFPALDEQVRRRRGH
ncbi:MAG: transglutaminase family protein [Desulfovibrio sp.]|nr:transglutaminase family protein [Desulfovibrio sp.]